MCVYGVRKYDIQFKAETYNILRIKRIESPHSPAINIHTIVYLVMESFMAVDNNLSGFWFW